METESKKESFSVWAMTGREGKAEEYKIIKGLVKRKVWERKMRTHEEWDAKMAEQLKERINKIWKIWEESLVSGKFEGRIIDLGGWSWR